MMGVCWRACIPLAFGTLGLTAAWVSGLRSQVLRSAQGTLSVVMFALSLFVIAYFVRRVHANLSSADAQVNVNPWL
jgi:membrane protein implicated in regulation of membrane protease activity